MVESQPSKLLVAGSIPVSRSIRLTLPFAVWQTARFAHGEAIDAENALSEQSESKGH